MKTMLFLLAMAAATVTLSMTEKASAQDGRGVYGCTIYEHAGGKGNLQRHTVDKLISESPGVRFYEREVRYVGDAWNDRISSIECDRNEKATCHAVVYAHIDFGLPNTGVYPNGKAPTNLRGDWNDRISSFKVRCEMKVLRSSPAMSESIRIDSNRLPSLRRIESVNGRKSDLELTTGETIVIRGSGLAVPTRDSLQGWLVGEKGGGIYLTISDVTDTKIVARLTQTSAARTFWNRNQRQAIRLTLRGDDWDRDVSLNIPNSVYLCVPTDALCR